MNLLRFWRTLGTSWKCDKQLIKYVSSWNHIKRFISQPRNSPSSKSSIPTCNVFSYIWSSDLNKENTCKKNGSYDKNVNSWKYEQINSALFEINALSDHYPTVKIWKEFFGGYPPLLWLGSTGFHIHTAHFCIQIAFCPNSLVLCRTQSLKLRKVFLGIQLL